MRELKFRAWVNEHWVNWIPTCKTLGAYNASVIDTDGYTYEKENPFIVEQYTGLKDKNGKEIYEGDIVKTNSPDRANFNAGAIVMQQQMYLIINTPTYGDARLSHSEPLGYYCDMECEIIGNIHENPELVGGEE